MRKRFLAVAMSAALAVSLCPALAAAAPLTGGSADVGAPAKRAAAVKTTKAKKVKMWVLVGADEGDEETYVYKNGLLVSNSSYKFSYKGYNLKSIKSVYNPSSDKFSVKSKKGMPVSATQKGSDSKTVYKYSRDRKGNLTQAKVLVYSKSYSGAEFKKLENVSTYTTDCTLNKKGRITKTQETTSFIDGSGSWSSPVKYIYDKGGNLKRTESPYQYSSTSYSYKYEKGHAKSRTYVYKYSDGGSYKYTMLLRYKQVAVPKKYESAVKAQQWALLNNNMNKAFGPVSPGIY